jgi:hypothetical protein
MLHAQSRSLDPLKRVARYPPELNQHTIKLDMIRFDFAENRLIKLFDLNIFTSLFRKTHCLDIVAIKIKNKSR